MATPGVIFILRVLPGLLLPPACIYIARYVLDAYLNISIPSSYAWLGFAISMPSYIAAVILWSSYVEKREAAAMGAMTVPLWQGKWPASVDLILLFRKFQLGYPGEGFWEVIERLGPTWSVRILWTNHITTYEPEHIKAILVTDFANYEKGSKFQFAMESMLGTGVFNSDGELWKFHRSMTRPFFSRDRISHFDLFDRHAEDAISQMKQRFQEGYAIDFQDVMSRFTLDSAAEFLFGARVHSLASDLPYPANVDTSTIPSHSRSSADDFTHAFADAQFTTLKRLRMAAPWPLAEVFRDCTKAPMEIVNAYLDPIIKDALEKKRRNEEAGILHTKKDGDIDDDLTLLDHLVNLTDNRKILKDETLNIMIAGRDTTASTLTFVTYLLAMHPDVLKRLRAEIIAKVGISRRPTYDDIREMKYLRAVINETLRLYPPVPLNIRDSIKATTLPSIIPGGKPLYIPAKTSVAYSVFMMHRRADLWGPDALQFDPDRFLDERLHKYLTSNPFIFLPFNAGPRICLGQQFAYSETSFMLVRLLQNFDTISLDTDAQPAGSRPPAYWANEGGRQAMEKIVPKFHLTMYAHQGFWVKMRAVGNP